MGEFAEFDIDVEALERLRERETRRFLRAARGAVEESSRALRDELQGATASAGLGRLAQAWRHRVYPLTGLADEPVGLVAPKGTVRTRGAMRAHGGESSGVIRARRGALAIPLPGSGARRTETPAEYQFRTGNKLRLVPRRGSRPALLVLDNARESGKRRIAKRNRSANARRRATVPIFVLIPQVDLRARFSIKSIRSRYPGRLVRSFAAHLNAGSGN